MPYNQFSVPSREIQYYYSSLTSDINHRNITFNVPRNFVGWSTTSTGFSNWAPYAANASYTITGNARFYAIFSQGVRGDYIYNNAPDRKDINGTKFAGWSTSRAMGNYGDKNYPVNNDSTLYDVSTVYERFAFRVKFMPYNGSTSNYAAIRGSSISGIHSYGDTMIEEYLGSWGGYSDLQDGMDVYIEPGAYVEFYLVGKRHATIDKITNNGRTWYVNYLYENTATAGEMYFKMTLQRSSASAVPSVGTNFNLKYQSSSSQTKITGTPAVLVEGDTNALIDNEPDKPYIQLYSHWLSDSSL